jgi:hypothetical protein
MHIIRSVSRLAAVAAVAALLAATVARPADAQSPASAGGFDGSKFTCLNYTNGLGENATLRAQSMIAQLWIEGYLAGFYKAQGKLELSADKADEQTLDNLMLQRCREFAEYSILTVAQQAIGKEPHKLPAEAFTDFAPASYTCGQHVDAMKGSAGDANRADLAELWAFAFIQGYKNASQPQMIISLENKSLLVGAVDKNCGNNRNMSFLDLTALVAEKVKLADDSGGKK